MKKTLALTALAAMVIGGTLFNAPSAEAHGCHHDRGQSSYNTGYNQGYNPYNTNCTAYNSNYVNPYMNAYGRAPIIQRLRYGLGF